MITISDCVHCTMYIVVTRYIYIIYTILLLCLYLIMYIVVTRYIYNMIAISDYGLVRVKLPLVILQVRIGEY